MEPTICILGGLGYIGRHAALQFLQQGFCVLIVDKNGTKNAPVFECFKTQYPGCVTLVHCDVTHENTKLSSVFATYQQLTTVIFTLRNLLKNQIIHTLINLQQVFAAKLHIRQFIVMSSVDIYAGSPLQLDAKAGGGKYCKQNGYNNQNTLACLVFLKEKMCHEIYVKCPHVSLVLLRVSETVGSHPHFWDLYNVLYFSSPSSSSSSSLHHRLVRHYVNKQATLLLVDHCPTTIDGSINANLICVQDVAKAIWCTYSFLLNLKQDRIFKIYNIANDYMLTTIQWLRHIVEANYVSTPRFVLLKNPLTDMTNAIKRYDINDACTDLSWMPTPYKGVVKDLGSLLAYMYIL